MYHKYLVYIDDGDLVFKIAIAAACEKSARIQCEGCGTVVAVRDVTDEIKIDAIKVCKALHDGGFSVDEVDFITRLLTEFGVAE